MLFGIGISLGTALLQTKGATWLANIVVAEFGLKNATALFILGVMSLFLIVIHLGFASATALASAMIPIVIAVLQGVATPGINIIGMTMLLQFVVSFGFILVVNAPQNMVAYGTETFEARDFVPHRAGAHAGRDAAAGRLCDDLLAVDGVHDEVDLTCVYRKPYPGLSNDRIGLVDAMIALICFVLAVLASLAPLEPNSDRSCGTTSGFSSKSFTPLARSDLR